MSNNNEFEKLSKNLDDKERKELLQKIQKTADDKESSGGGDRTDRKFTSQFSYAKKIYNQSDFLSKIIIWFISLFTGQKKEDVVLNRIFEDIKKDIQLHYGRIIDFKRDIFTINFANELSALVDACERCIPIVDKYISNNNFYHGFVSKIIEDNFDEKLSDELKKIDPMSNEMSLEYVEKDDFLKKKSRFEKAFFNKLTLTTFTDLNSMFIKVELLSRLITFNFTSLLYSFSTIDQKFADISGVKFATIDTSLEKLYAILDRITFQYPDITFLDQMIDYSKFNPIEEKDVDVYFSENELNKIKKLLSIISHFKDKIPLKQIFQYYKKNLNYKPIPFSVKYDCINIYKGYKQKIINSSWDVHYDKIKDANQKKLVNELFNDNLVYVLAYFNNELKVKLDKKSNIKLKNVQKLNMLTKFVDKIYKEHIEKIINKILIDGSFVKDSFRNNISSAYYLLFNSLERIKTFDKQLNPDRDIGKKVATFLKITMNEVDFAQTLQNTVIDINDMSSEVIDEVYNSLWTISNFSINLATNIENPKSAYITNFDRIKIPGFLTSLQAITRVIKFFDLFFKIYANIEDY